METGKKLWSKPQLVVLVRGRPEEAVLCACKHNKYNSSGAGSYNCTTSGSMGFAMTDGLDSFCWGRCPKPTPTPVPTYCQNGVGS